MRIDTPASIMLQIADSFAVVKAVGLDTTKTKIIFDEIAEKISALNVF